MCSPQRDPDGEGRNGATPAGGSSMSLDKMAISLVSDAISPVLPASPAPPWSTHEEGVTQRASMRMRCLSNSGVEGKRGTSRRHGKIARRRRNHFEALEPAEYPTVKTRPKAAPTLRAPLTHTPHRGQHFPFRGEGGRAYGGVDEVG